MQEKANKLRASALKAITKAGSGHPGGSLSAADIIATLYFEIMNHDPDKPSWEDRDRFVLSNGHICPVLYAALAEAGYFSANCLESLREFDSPLQGHPERERLPGLETTSGPLGSGLAQAAGMAVAAKLDDKRYRVFCLTSDGEHNEGNHWEAVMFAKKYKLSNLTVFIDRNFQQLSGPTSEIMPTEPLAAKYKAFGWNSLEIDGHDFDAIKKAVDVARRYYQGPTAIIAKTRMGKGVSFMENDYNWHGKAPSIDELKKALKELNVK